MSERVSYAPARFLRRRASIVLALLVGMMLVHGTVVPSRLAADLAPNAPDPYAGDGASGFHAVAPARLTTLSIPANQTHTITGTGKSGIPASGVDALSLMVTMSGAPSSGQLFIWPVGKRQPSAATGRIPRRATATLSVLSKIGATSFRVRATTAVTLRFDVTGWYDRFSFLGYDPTSGLQYHSVSPARLRTGVVAEGSTVGVQVTRKAGVPRPAKARAAAVHITVTNAGGRGYVTSGGARVLSFGTASATSLALLKLNSQGKLRLKLHGADANLKVDVVGYFGRTGNDIVTGQSSLIPGVRLFRATLSGTQSRSVTTGGKGTIPFIGAESVFVQVSVSSAAGAGSIAFHGAGQGEPATRSVSFGSGNSVSMAVAEMDFQTGRIAFTKRGASATVKIRALGWNAFVIPPPPTVTEPPPDPSSLATSPSTVTEAQNSSPLRAVRPGGLDEPTKVGGVSPQRTVIRQDPATAVAAWTEDDLARAEPVPLPGEGSDPNNFHGNGLSYPVYNAFKSDYLPAANYDNRIGRLYVRDVFDNLVAGFCTATVVARNLVITAAHCLTSLVSQPTAVVFAPGQNGGNAHSLWGASVIDYYTFYQTNNFQPLDFAVIVIPPTVGGDYLGDYVGWHAIYGGYASGPIYHVGYPGEGWWTLNGRCGDLFCDPYYQWSPQADYYSPADGWWEQAYGGWVNGGASGGPIFQYVTGYGWLLTSVVSHGDNTIVTCAQAGVICGEVGERYYGRNTWVPVFNNWVLDLYYDYAIT